MHTRLSLNIPKRNITTFLSLRKQLTNANQYKVIEGITAKKNLNEPIQNSKSKPKKVSSRILGIAHSPKLEETQPKRLGWIERFKNIFDAEKNRENREKLLKEYNTPYWKDFDELRKEGGKLWEAETELVNAQKALYMPNIKARSLSKSAIDTTDLLEGHTTLVAIFFNQFGENHTQTFIKPFLDEFSDHDKIQLMKVNIEVNFAKSLILKLMTPYLKITIPAHLHKNYIILFHNDPNLRKALDINNSYRGYVFLVDSNCKLRWAAHGNATPREVETMSRLVKILDEQNQSTVK